MFTNKIKIDIISDVVCPFCVIGYKRLEKAIIDMGIEAKVEIVWHPFELNPMMSPKGENALDYLANKYGMSIDHVKAFQGERMQNGKELGFTFDYFEAMKTVNTRDAHILLDFAKEFGKQTLLQMRLFGAYFSERKDISDREILVQELKNVGLDINLSLERLDSEARTNIQNQEDYWHKRGVSAVPTIVFNGDTTLNGAYPVETYQQILTELLG